MAERHEDTWELLTPSSSTNSIASPSSPYVVVRTPQFPNEQTAGEASSAARGPQPSLTEPSVADRRGLKASDTKGDPASLAEPLLGSNQPLEGQELERTPSLPLSQAEQDLHGTDADVAEPQQTLGDDGPESLPSSIKSDKSHHHIGMSWKLFLSWPVVLPLVLTTLVVVTLMVVHTSQITMRRPNDGQARGVGQALPETGDLQVTVR